MRKTPDAPNGTMDFMFTSLIAHFKEINYKTVNFGMVPLSGIDEPTNLPEQAMKLAYKKIKQFNQYKQLRFFKEKFNPLWIKTYAIYSTDLDLVNLPVVLKKVMKPI